MGISWPPEFLCPIASRPMSDPVILSSGQSYERNCIAAWTSAGQTRCYLTGRPFSREELGAEDPSHFVPNLSLRTAIHRFCNSSTVPLPPPISLHEAEEMVAALIPQELRKERTPVVVPRIYHSATNFKDGGSSTFSGGGIPLPFFSTPSSAPRDRPSAPPIPTRDAHSARFASLLRSDEEEDQEAGASELRQMTRDDPASREHLGSDEGLVSALVWAMSESGSSRVQCDVAATIVNLSLVKENRVRLVRCGALEPLVEAAGTGSSEARGHAAAALFSLSVETENRIVLAVAGAIQPLLRLLGSSNKAAAEDAAMALYYLSLEKSNKSKLIRAGAIPTLVRTARSSPESGVKARCFMILCSLAVVEEGRRTMVSGGALAGAMEAVEHSTESGPAEEHALALLLLLMGKGNGKFAAAGMEAGVMRAVGRLAQHGTGRAKEKAVALLRLVKETQAAEMEDSDREVFPPPPSLGGGFGGRNSYTGANTSGF